ncbi:MAG: type secretion system permease/ATPase [Phenylobacterium sp.]|nr:type secretion system permease/ATPase [Phenylobacterium sp.]
MTPDAGLGALALVLGFHQIATDLAPLSHALGKGEAAEISDLVRLRVSWAPRPGRRGRLSRASPTRQPPLIAERKDGGFMVVVAVRGGKALVQVFGTAPQTIDLETLEADLIGRRRH